MTTNKPHRKYAPLKQDGDDASTNKRVVPEARQRIDVHEAITAKIVAAIEAGAGEFQMPWHRPGVVFTLPKNALTEKTYRGSNILSLWIDADDKKFERQTWATFKQWVRRESRMKGVTSWVREQCPALSPHPACRAGNGTV